MFFLLLVLGVPLLSSLPSTAFVVYASLILPP